MSEKKNKNTASLGYLFWIAFILLIIVLFFFNKTNISNALGKNGARDLMSGNKKGTELNGNSAAPIIPQINTKEDLVATPPVGDGSTVTHPAQTQPAETTAQPTAPVSKPDATIPQPATSPASSTAKTAAPEKTAPEKSVLQTKPAEKTVPVKKPATTKTPAVPSRTATLYFVKIDSDGKVLQQQVSREISKGDSPLSEALATLFKGTSTTEANKGYRSLIPAGTKLLSAIVKDGVATVNVSEEFQFNQYGIEGYLGQLEQIVFTATSFPTVKSVQFLIEGQRREYLGAEGVWIGTPLSRDKF